MTRRLMGCVLTAAAVLIAAPAMAQQSDVPAFATLVDVAPKLKPELVGVHPRVFVTKEELDQARTRAHSSEATQWARALKTIPAFTKAPPPPPGPQERRSQN